MTFAAPEPISSGTRYAVTLVGAGPPSSLEDFVGDIDFTIDKEAEPYVIYGSGRRISGDQVRFHEKDKEHGKDIRVWHITARAAGFDAEHAAFF
jgi:hypothetical protein